MLRLFTLVLCLWAGPSSAATLWMTTDYAFFSSGLVVTDGNPKLHWKAEYDGTYLTGNAILENFDHDRVSPYTTDPAYPAGDTYVGVLIMELYQTPGRWAFSGRKPNDDGLSMTGSYSLVPLPATLPLLATALGGLVLLRARRRTH